ncbi:sodium-dependent multivitamin transporter-like [Ruditapes philippinarum]|uniref:sodium-dependent multivitamin transporter-like n=1 Tax=Ruditapes philippinarum TaxID=129788 RepID=UPI00295B1F58|nr:sodium-dependent multivitamin transporter-like [Ruditapes philippinarum]
MSSASYSILTGEKKTFHPADYAVFGCTLAFSAAIGIFYAIKDRRKNNTENYLLAGRSMNPFPVAMSLVSSFVSAIMIIGTPAEVYVNSTMYGWQAVGMVITAAGAAHIFIPVFYNLGVTSVFQYVEMRFGRVTRTIASVVYIIWMMFYMAIVLYGPSLALNAVTGLSLWGSILAVSSVCIFYTALGGMKAVLWADTFQVLVMFAGLFALLIEGTKALGGIGKAWDIANKDGRIILLEFDPDPRVRHSVWNLVIGGGIFWCAVYGTNQAQVQRAISVRNVSRSKIAIWLNVIGYDTILLLCCLVGVVMYAFYSECDPVKSGLVDKPDQLVPLWMMDLLSEYPGLPGLFLSTIFSGSLSSVSSGLNAIAAVMLEDFIKPTCCKNISDSTATWLSKGIVVVFGCLSIAFAFVVSNFGTLILTLANVLFGALGGPMLGMFCLGMLFPWSNKVGGCIGLVCGLIMNIWISFGTAITKTSVNIKSPISVDGCIWKYSNTTTLTTTSTTTSMTSSSVETVSTTHIFDKYEGINRLYTVSYMWYSGIGVCTVVVVGMIVSLITGITDTSKLNPKLICPIFDVFFPFLPEKWRKPLRFGVRHGKKDFDEFEDTEKRKALLKKFEGVD